MLLQVEVFKCKSRSIYDLLYKEPIIETVNYCKRQTRCKQTWLNSMLQEQNDHIILYVVPLLSFTYFLIFTYLKAALVWAMKIYDKK